MLLGIFGASLLWSMLVGNELVWAGEGASELGKRTIRAGEGAPATRLGRGTINIV